MNVPLGWVVRVVVADQVPDEGDLAGGVALPPELRLPETMGVQIGDNPAIPGEYRAKALRGYSGVIIILGVHQRKIYCIICNTVWEMERWLQCSAGWIAEVSSEA